MSVNLQDVKSVNIIQPASNYRYMAVFLCSVAVIINFIDRVNFSVATPSLMQVFSLNATTMGVVMSAFFYVHIPIMLVVGAMLNKYGSKKVMGYGLLGWGVATMATAVATSVKSFVLVRAIMGGFEATCFPATVRVVSVWVPLRERTFASACFDACARAAAAFTPPLVVAILVAWGWKASFVITGALAFVYAFIWLFAYKEPDEHPKVTQSELDYIRQNEVVIDNKVVAKTIPMLKLFKYPTIMTAAIAYFGYLYVWNVFSSWLPSYLVIAKGFSLKAMGIGAMIPYATSVVLELTGGAFFDRWYRSGASINTLRRVGMGIAMIGASVFIYFTTQATTPFWIIFFFSCYCGICGFGACNVQAIPSDLAPYGQAGGVSGLINFVAQWGGFTAPMVTGFIVDTKYGYDGAFVVTSAIALVSGLLYLVNNYKRVEPKAADL